MARHCPGCSHPTICRVHGCGAEEVRRNKARAVNQQLTTEPVSDAYELEPVAWMAQHGRQPVQATVSKQQAEAWVQAGGDVHALYDGQTLWNAVARAGEIERDKFSATLRQAREALQATMAAWGGTCAWHADVKAAIAAIDALGPNEKGNRPA